MMGCLYTAITAVSKREGSLNPKEAPIKAVESKVYAYFIDYEQLPSISKIDNTRELHNEREKCMKHFQHIYNYKILIRQ
jgi:competence protein ComGC